jgi:hypothetical protein
MGIELMPLPAPACLFLAIGVTHGIRDGRYPRPGTTPGEGEKKEVPDDAAPHPISAAGEDPGRRRASPALLAAIAANSAGISNSGSVTATGTIIANNNPGTNCFGNRFQEPFGFNLDSGTTCRLSQATDLSSTDPLLGPLAGNGGPTQTQALQPGSPAIDHGGTSANGCPPADQRGITRPQGPACDIGAFELAQ